MRAPAELTMLGKTLLHLDEVARALDPKLDVNEAIRRNGVDLMSQRMRKIVTSGSVIASVLEAKEFAAKLPGRVNRVLDALAASELKMKVEVIDDGAIIDGLQKVANRITLGLILAAMIVSAAMVMRDRDDVPDPGLSWLRDDPVHAGVCRRRLSRGADRPPRSHRSITGDAGRVPDAEAAQPAVPAASASSCGRAASYRPPADPRHTKPKGVATAWTRVRRLLWSWWPWALARGLLHRSA